MFTHQQGFPIANVERGNDWGALGGGTAGGMAWVNRGAVCGTDSTRNSVVSAFQQQDYQQNPYAVNISKVSLYTRYYHEWKAIADASASTAAQKEWATYYADLSSRAAHYYHQNPNTTQPPTHDLPPAPPGCAADAVEGSQRQESQSLVERPKVKDHNSGLDPTSFQVYVDKCLQQCRTPDEKAEIVSATKTVLQKAIKEGQLHKKDWSREPLIALSANKEGIPSLPSLPSSLSQTRNLISKQTGSIVRAKPIPSPSKATKQKQSSSKTNEKTLYSNKRSYPESTATVSRNYYGPSDSSISLSPTGSTKRVKLAKDTQSISVSSSVLDRRAKRFAGSFQHVSFDSCEDTNHGYIVIGSCQTLEKEYFRLTSAPKPELVRPQNILEKHFSNLKSEYANLKRRRDYLWFCSQLKAIRQDCTVQHLKNDFCVWVYEFHAKAALENGDINEFNQCQTQLKYLYPLVEGSALLNRSEFLGYRILYAVYLNLHSDNASIDMKDILAGENTADPSVTHALAVLSAAQEGNYHNFFTQLYPSSYGYQNYLLERMTPIFRRRALEVMCCAYRPSIEVGFVCDSLRIDDRKWLEKVGCILGTVRSEPHGSEVEVIRTKESDIKEPDNAENVSKLM